MSLWRNGDPLDDFITPGQASPFLYIDDPQALSQGFDLQGDPLSDFIAWGPIVPMGASYREREAGLDSVGEGPGDCWMQAPTKKETQQGFKKTDAMTLAIRAANIRAKAEELEVQAAGTIPEISQLKADAIQLSLNCNSFRDYPQNYTSSPQEALKAYQGLLAKVNALQATLDDILSRIEPAPEDEPPPPPKQVTVKVPATPTQPATTKVVTQPVPPPEIKLKPKTSTFTLAMAAAAAAVIVTKVAGLW